MLCIFCLWHAEVSCHKNVTILRLLALFPTQTDTCLLRHSFSGSAKPWLKTCGSLVLSLSFLFGLEKILCLNQGQPQFSEKDTYIGCHLTLYICSKSINGCWLKASPWLQLASFWSLPTCSPDRAQCETHTVSWQNVLVTHPFFHTGILSKHSPDKHTFPNRSVTKVLIHNNLHSLLRQVLSILTEADLISFGAILCKSHGLQWSLAYFSCMCA